MAEIEHSKDDIQARFEEFHALRERIVSGEIVPKGMPKQAVDRIVGMLDGIESSVKGMLAKANDTAMEFRGAARMLNEMDFLDDVPVNDRSTQESSKGVLGSLVGGFGRMVTQGTGTILNAALPMTKSVLNTSANLVNSVASTASNVAGSVVKTAGSVAASTANTATNVASSLVSQTANLASSLTSSTTKAMSSILGSGTKAAASAVSSILNPPGGGGISDLVGKTASVASGIANAAAPLASSLTSSAATLASSLTSTAGSAVFSMVGAASNFASNMIGGAADSLVNSVFGGASSAISGATSAIGGMFGSAASSAASLAGGAVEAASGLVDGLASGLGGLAGGLLGSATDVASGLLSAGANAATGMLDTAGKLLGGDSSTTPPTPGLLDAASGIAGSMLDTAGNVAGGLMDTVGGLVQGAGDLTTGLFDGISNFIKGEDEENKDNIDSGNDGDGEGDGPEGEGEGEGEGGDGPGGDDGDDGDDGSDPEPEVDSLPEDALNTAEQTANSQVDTAGDMADQTKDMVDNIINDYINSAAQEAEKLAQEMQNSMDELNQRQEEMQNEWNPNNWDRKWEEDENNRVIDGIEQTLHDPKLDLQTKQPEPKPVQPAWNPNWGAQPDPAKNSATVTPLTADTPPQDNGLQVKPARSNSIGFRSFKAEHVFGALAMMHDGDQQLLNPYGRDDSAWTIYSFRPADTIGGKDPFPQIAITPSSFEAISSLHEMLDKVPYVVVKEYFFKNTASTVINFIKKLMDTAQDILKSPGDGDEQSDQNDKESNTMEKAKEIGSNLMNKIKDTFENISLGTMAVDIPYILYTGLRKRMYGNTYIFPYIIENGARIQESSNDGEWNPPGKDGIAGFFKNMLQGAVNMVGGMALSAAGSQAKPAPLFPQPVWGESNGGAKPEFKMDLVLINDNVVKARNNYMCVNTIIHNNRSMQKAILSFPGALYEVWLPTGQRHIMCTGTFELSALGLNRRTPKGFFYGTGPGASFRIGSDDGQTVMLEQEHKDGEEVVPDAYKLAMTYKSCFANNLNTSIFQYYVKMTAYDPQTKTYGNLGGQENTDSAYDKTLNGINDIQKRRAERKAELDAQMKKEKEAAAATKTPPATPTDNTVTPNPTNELLGITPQAQGLRGQFQRALDEIADDTSIEKFDEATYNKRIGKIKSSMGDTSLNSDSVVTTIKRTQRAIRESTDFLERLYGAEGGSVWWSPDGDGEIYTSIEPDYRQQLRKQYGDRLNSLRKIDTQAKEAKRELDAIQKLLTKETDLQKRDPLIERRVKAVAKVNTLKAKRSDVADEMIQIDTDIIKEAFDEHDSTMSIKRQSITKDVLQQVWNERIMNSYERDKVQYMTSEEKKRYYEEKIRALERIDEHGILNHEDWFFRIAVLDHVVREMQRLVYWFKNCSYDDFDTIYRIVRKLNLLLLDVESVRSKAGFDINATNLFTISDEDMREYTKLDGLLMGSTLYELFNEHGTIWGMKYPDSIKDVATTTTTKPDKTIIQEQQSEMDIEKQRTVREDVVARTWKSEQGLTKAAYEKANVEGGAIDPPVTIGDTEYTTMGQMKDRIVELKLKSRSGDEDDELKELLGSFTGFIRAIKEAMVLDEIAKMQKEAQETIEKKEGSVNAKVMPVS